MWFARDIKDKIKSILDSDFSTMLTTIDTERGTTTRAPARIATDESLKQLPELVISLGDSSFSDNSGTYKSLEEEFDIAITCFLQDTTIEKTENMCENYIEALLRIFQGYKDEMSDFEKFSVSVTQALRDPVYTANGQTRKEAAVRLKVKRNYQ